LVEYLLGNINSYALISAAICYVMAFAKFAHLPYLSLDWIMDITDITRIWICTC